MRGNTRIADIYGGNKSPEWLTCCHEETSVNIANGYYAVEGKPMAVMTFAPSGLLHAAMAIHGSYTAHTPTYILVANIVDAMQRRPGTDWGNHSMLDPGAVVRDTLKWDDSPTSLQHFAESAGRAYKMAMTEPRGPVLVVVDAGLAELTIPDRSKLRIPKLTLTSPPVGDPAEVAQIAKLLVSAENRSSVAGESRARRAGHESAGGARRKRAKRRQGGGRSMPNRHP